MSEIFDLTNDLFDAISESMDDRSHPFFGEVRDCENDSIEHTINTSIELLEDCTSTLLRDVRPSEAGEEDLRTWNGHNPSEYVNLNKGDVITKDCSTTLDNENYEPTPSIFVRKSEQKSEEETKANGDLFMRAAMKRIKRQREAKGRGVRSSQIREETEEKGQENDNHGSDAPLEMNKDAETAEVEAIACFESFRSDVESFKAKWDREENGGMVVNYEFACEFARTLDRKYTSRLQRLSLLKNANDAHYVKVAKIKKLIHAFGRRCRALIEFHGKDDTRTRQATADMMKLCKILCASTASGASKKKSKVLCKFKYWTCKVCNKKDLEFEQSKCSCCGRPKTYRPPQTDEMTPQAQMFHDPTVEGEEFLSGASFNNEKRRQQSKSREEIKEERIRKQYLYRKDDLELDLRTELKEEVGNLIDSINNTKRRLQL